MRAVKIPEWMNPYTITINGKSYTYPAGGTVEVEDFIADAIEGAKFEPPVAPVVPSGGVSSWNDLTDKPFYAETENSKEITWDGNASGHEVISTMIGMIEVEAVKLSDCAPVVYDGETQQLLYKPYIEVNIDGSILFSTENEYGELILSNNEPIGVMPLYFEDFTEQDGIMFCEPWGSTKVISYFVIVYSDAGDLTKGTYAVKAVGTKHDETFGTKLAFDEPVFVNEILKKLDSKYLPDALQFGETYGDTLTWDGDITGRENYNAVLYKVSDAVVTKDDLSAGYTIVTASEDEYTLTDNAFVVDDVAAGGLNIYGENPEYAFPMVIYIYDSTASGCSQGIYFPDYPGLGDVGCVRAFTIPGYKGFPVTKRLDEKYMPLLTSPNGTQYKLTVADDGTLTATAV